MHGIFLLGWIDVEVAHTVLSVATTHSIFSFAVNGMRNSFMVCEQRVYIEVKDSTDKNTTYSKSCSSVYMQYTCSTHANYYACRQNNSHSNFPHLEFNSNHAVL